MPRIDYDGMANFYTYMGWQLITDPTSKQYQLKQDSGMPFDSEGFGVINGRYVVALTEFYGEVGDEIDFVLADGTNFPTIIGDIKSSNDPNWTKWGHVSGNNLNVIEFVVDYDTWYNPMHANPGTSSCHPEWAGQIQTYNYVGNYWGESRPGSIAMGNLKFVEATRYANGQERTVSYIATLQTDGYVYFNDDIFWRCKIDGSLPQLWYPSKNIWVITSAIYNISIKNFTTSGTNGNAGSGSGVAPNADVEAAVQWMVNKANSEYVTYSQSNRNLKNPNGSSYDCSSFVITGFYMGGFDAASSYTGDMISGFTALGFEWIPGGYWTADQLIRGDILLNIVNHTQVYIGNNQDVNCGSTPACVQGHSIDYYGSPWDGILRYAG